MAQRSKKIRPKGDDASMAAWLSRDWFWGLLLALAVVVTYLPVLQAGFIWDDDAHVSANPCIIGPLGLKQIWTTSAAQYYPLVLTTFWIEHALWGLRPLPYHVVDVLLQAACAITLWQVLRALRIPGAWLGAALWALHPVQVESTAWITETKNTQSGLFYLLAILFFVKGLRGPEKDDSSGKSWNYTLTLLWAALAMASKSSTIVLPAVLCLCAWWVEGRWNGRSLIKIGPIFLMSAVSAALALWTVDLQGVNLDSQWSRSWPERIAASGDVVWFYLGKLLWPHPLIFIYPRWSIDPGHWTSYLPLLAVILVFLVLWFYRNSWSRACLFALAYFLVALFPVLGLVQHYFLRYSLVADHLQFLASMGPLALAGAGLTQFSDRIISSRLWLRASPGACLLLVLGTVSWQRTSVYHDVDTLWSDTLAKNPQCWMAYNNLGLSFYEKGQLDEAMTDYHKALEIDPQLAEPHNNLGNALIQKRQVNEAVAEYQKALEIDPSYSRAHNNLGNALFQTGQVDDAIAHYQRALEIDPRYVDAYNDLGIALLRKGQADEAISQYRKALEIEPTNADAHNNLGNALYQKGEMEEAGIEYQKALETDPTNPKAHNGLGNALNQSGKVDDAIVEYQKALAIDPRDADAHNDLGVTLLQKGQVDEAIDHFQQALAITPNNANAHFSLGYALAQKGRLYEAIAQFQEVVRLDPGNRDALNNLAQAQALVRKSTPPK